MLDSLRFGAPPRPWTLFTYNQDLEATVTRFAAGDSLSRRIIEPHRSSELRAPGLNENYGYDVHARLLTAQDLGTNRLRTFTYDSLSRLRQTAFGTPTWCGYAPYYGHYCTGGTDSTHAFSFDAVGNRLDHGGSYTMSGNRITDFDGVTYETDADGGVSRAYVINVFDDFQYWSADGLLDSVITCRPSCTRVQFRYDALGRLVRRDVNWVVADAGATWGPTGHGATASVEGGGGVFWGNGGVRLGAYEGGAAVVGGPAGSIGTPSANTGVATANVVLGAGANAGPGIFVTNARGASELAGNFRTVQIGVGPLNVSLGCGGGTWIASASWNPVPAQLVTVTSTTTNTYATYGGNGCQ